MTGYAAQSFAVYLAAVIAITGFGVCCCARDGPAHAPAPWPAAWPAWAPHGAHAPEPHLTTASAKAKAKLSPISCLANVSITGKPWSDPSGYHNVVNVDLKNLGSATVKIPYNITYKSKSFTGVLGAWNWVTSVPKNGTIEGVFNYGAWQDLKPKGNSTSSFGFIATSSTQSFKPSSISLNGTHACKIVY